MRAAITVPEPDEEPPVTCSGFHGLRAGGKGRSKLGPPMANSCVAQQHAAGCVQPCGRDAVLLRHVIQEQFGMAGRADAGRVVDVLQRIRDPVERPAVAPRLQLIVGAARIGEGAILGHQDEGVQRAVACRDASQRIAGERFRGDATGAQHVAHLGDGEVLRLHHLPPAAPRRNTLDGSASGP
jgi:hypothetical protein